MAMIFDLRFGRTSIFRNLVLVQCRQYVPPKGRNLSTTTRGHTQKKKPERCWLKKTWSLPFFEKNIEQKKNELKGVKNRLEITEEREGITKRE